MKNIGLPICIKIEQTVFLLLHFNIRNRTVFNFQSVIGYLPLTVVGCVVDVVGTEK